MTYRSTGKCGNNSGSHCYTGRRTIFRNRCFREMNVNILCFVKVRINLQLLCTGTDKRNCSLCTFLHDSTQIAGNLNLAGTRYNSNFNLQHFTAYTGPRQAVYNTDFILLCNIILFIMRRSQKLLEIFRTDNNTLYFPVSNTLSCFTAKLCKNLFQLSDTGLTSISGNNILQNCIANREIGTSETVFFHLFRKQMSLCNLKFFFFLYEKLFIKRHCTDMFMCSTLAGEWSYGKKAVQDGRVRMSKNGIEVERFRYNEEVRREVRRELNVEDKIVIGHAGRFMQQKNHMFLMDIFRKIHDRNPDTVLLLCGEGRLEEDIRRKVKELELEDHVRFLGVRPDMDRMYQGFDLFLLPSLWEGLPVVGIEAQTSGLPILMSDVITPEVEVTPCVKKLSLKTSPEVWAQTALDMIREHQRQDEYQRIVDAGFDIRETAKWWQNYYLEKYREENEN